MFSYLNTTSDFQDTQFARGNVSTEFLGKKGSGVLAEFRA